MALTIASGVTIEGGITAGNVPVPPDPTLMLNLDAAGYTSGDWVDTVGSKAFALYNSPTWSSDGGGSFTFVPASSQYAASTTSLASLETWTVVVWHYYTGVMTGYAPCLVTEQWPSATNDINYSVGCNLAGGSPPYLSSGYFHSTWNTTPAYTGLSANNWYQIVGTYDGTTNRLWVNTVMVESQVSNGATPHQGANGIRLMRRWDDADYWGGKLAKVAIYDGAMSFSNITTDWEANRARFGL